MGTNGGLSIVVVGGRLRLRSDPDVRHGKARQATFVQVPPLRDRRSFSPG